MRFPRAALVIALTTSMLVVGAPAYADNGAPQIGSLTRTSADALTAGQSVDVRLVVSDTGASTIHYVQLVFLSARGHYFVISKWVGVSAATVTASRVLGPWAASGRWTLDRAIIYDGASNTTTYRRDGSVEVRPSGAERPESSSLDLAAADFDVSNPNEDVTAPSVWNARAVFSHVTAGTPAVATYSVEDDRSGIESVWMQYYLPDDAVMFVSSPPGELAAIGPMSGLVPLFTAGGPATLAAIWVSDRAGNMMSVSPERLWIVPSGAEPPARADVDPEALSFTVHPVAPDTDFPALDRLTMRLSGRIPPGGRVSVDFAVSDPTTTATYADVVWEDDAGHSLLASSECVVLDEGRLTLEVASYWADGTRWRVAYARVNDRARHGTVYYRDGTIGHTAGNATSPTDLRHDIDLSQGDFVIDSDAAASGQAPAPSLCERTTIVDVIADPPLIALGSSSRLRGSVDAGGSSVDHPVAAMYAFGGARPRLLGVVRGTENGRFGLRVSPRADRTYRARFLGSDGANPALARMSDRIVIRIVPAPDLWARASATTVERGERVRIRAGATRARAGEQILLKRRTADGWRTVIERTLTDDLTATFLVRPRAGRSIYAVMIPAQGEHAAARSRRIEILAR